MLKTRPRVNWLAPTAVISVAALATLAPDRHFSIIPHAQAADLTAADSVARCPRGNATLLGAYMSMGGGTV